MKPFAPIALAPLALALCLTSIVPAQTQFTDPANLRGERVTPRDGRELPIDTGASGLAQLLRKLSTRASLMNIVAHPDDEDGGMLTLYSRGLGARVADLSLNRGEGGQNAMTADFEDALGLLRTQELLSNDRYVGVDQFFGTEVDFGFSKTKEESFAKWTHERVLYDVVRAIRLYRPLVLTSTWIGGVTDGHGQHQVAGQIAQEAFLAAGDPKVFPELTAEGILPWQPLRIYARVPMQSISPRGLYDYATNQYTPARFTNYVTGEVTTTPPTTDITIHEGTVDPLLTIAAGESVPLTTGQPSSYIQFSRLGLSQQKSQMGPGGRSAPTGAFDVAYHLYGNRVPTTDAYTPATTQVPQGFSLGFYSLRIDAGFSPQGMPSSPDPNFFTGIDVSLESIATLAPHAPPFLSTQLARMAADIQTATATFDPQNLKAVASPIEDALKTCDALIDRTDGALIDYPEKASVLHELRIKRTQLNDALALALGLHMEAITGQPSITTHSSLPVALSITAERAVDTDPPIACLTEKLSSTSGHFSASMLAGSRITTAHPLDDKLTAAPSLTAKETRPYFYRDSIEQPVYSLSDPTLRNAPITTPAITAWVHLSWDGVEFDMGHIVTSNNQPLHIVLPDDLSVPTHAQVFPNDWPSLRLSATVKQFTAITTEPRLTAPLPWKLENITYKQTAPNFYTSNLGTAIGESVWQLTAPTKSDARHPMTVTATATYGVTKITEGFRPVGYGDLPTTNFYTPAETRIVPINLTLPTRREIAYLPGTGDAVPEALTSIGLTPTLLTLSDLTPTKLSAYDTVILGVRTYAAHPDLHGAPTQALLDYARAGGNVIVQYQTPEFTAADAPFPLSLGTNEKVVDETAPVRLFDDKTSYAQRLLVVPNKITSADFNNWVEERGHGFLSTWDPRYTAPTETHDPGPEGGEAGAQAPQRGGLITTPLGDDPAHRGRWTYVAFALYRQLPEAVPGAFRLLANLLNP